MYSDFPLGLDACRMTEWNAPLDSRVWCSSLRIFSHEKIENLRKFTRS
jgi:hypothetical protein